jgi:hypothetical protein
MKLNKNKTAFLVPTRAKESNTTVTIGNIPIQKTKQIKNLGTIVTQDLKWSTNCKSIITKANIAFHSIKRNISFLTDVDTKQNIYNSYIIPIIQFGIEFVTYSINDTRAIDTFICRTLRWVTGNYDLSYKTVCINRQLFPFGYSQEIKIIMLIFKIINNQITIDIPFGKEILLEKIKQNDTPPIEYCRTNIGKHNFWYRSIRIIKLLPIKLDWSFHYNAKNQVHKIYNHLLQNYYEKENSCTWYLYCNCSKCTIKPQSDFNIIFKNLH